MLTVAVLVLSFQFAASTTLAKPTQLEAPEINVPWYEKIAMFHFPQLFALDLDGPSMRSQLSQATSEYALVEFYAPWCPHCQHFAPEFDRLGLAIRRLGQEKTLLTAAVDCVKFPKTCKEWEVQSYPTLHFGRIASFASEPRSLFEKVDVKQFNAQTVADWLEKRLHIGLDASKAPRGDLALFTQATPGLASGTSRILPRAGGDVWDAQLAAALLVRTALELGASSGKSHATLLSFVDLLARRFPAVSKCRASFADLASRLRDTPDIAADDLESHWQPCGTPYDTYASGWNSCRGTWPEKRGFTCGVWTLIHFVSAQPADTDAVTDLHTLRETIAEFFGCGECRDHFLLIPAPEANKKLTRRDAQLWWWSAHNIVNRRVMGIEDEYQDADPGFPKTPRWPAPELCQQCNRNSSSLIRVLRASSLLEKDIRADGWDPEVVGKFLDSYYASPVEARVQ